MGTCTYVSYCRNCNNQNGISIDVPTRTPITSNQQLNTQTNNNTSQPQFKMLTNVSGNSKKQENTDPSFSSKQTTTNDNSNNKIQQSSVNQNSYNTSNSNVTLFKKAKLPLHQSSPKKNGPSSQSTNHNSLSSSTTSANIICSNKNINDKHLHRNDNKKTSPFNNEDISISKEEEDILNNKNIVKVVILGGKGVGKTSFLLKILNNKFEKLYIPTIGIETNSKILMNEGKQYRIFFIVTPGDSIYKSNYSIYFQKANFIYVFYDMSIVNSFKEAKQLLLNEIDYKKLMKDNKTHINVVGNKKDIFNSKVDLNEIKTFCEENNLTLYEISVKSGIGLKVLMNDLCNLYDLDNQ